MKRHHILYFALLLTCILSHPLLSHAQSDMPLRLEFSAAKDQHDYNMVAADTQGLFVFYDAGSISTDTNRWMLLHYDTNLVKLRSIQISLPPQTDFIASDIYNGTTYLLMQKRTPKKATPRTFIVAIAPEKKSIDVTELDGIHAPDLSHLYAADGKLVLQATGGKSDFIYFYDIEKELLTCLNDIFNYKVESCVADTASNRWLIALHNSNSVQDDMFLYEYLWQNREGNLIQFPQQIPDKTSVLCQTSRIFPLNADTVLFLGTYNTLSDRQSINLHSGVYSLLLCNHKFDSLKTYNFTALKSGDPANTQSSNLNLQLQVGASAQTSRQYSIISEVFYPDYTYTYNTYNYDPYYYHSPSPTTTFAGYQFVNAYITTFDRCGNLLWDNYFPLTTVSIMQLSPVLNIDFIDEDALIHYPRNNKIVNTLINEYQTLEKLSTFSIETMSKRDVVEYNRDTDISRWYGNNFLVSGYQYLRNRDKATKAKRYVFFINKLEYR